MKNLSLMNVQLTRSEMRTVFGGANDVKDCLDYKECSSSSDCGDKNCSRCVEAVGGGGKACGA